MIISHNIQAMNTNRITNENINLHGKSTEKVSSGYRINRAGDDPAGLGISEVLRRQVRGLMQATNNTKDGVAFVQSADGAMEEIHSILQRMNELTVKALQGTYSDSDRMAMNVEFDQFRTEIDRINSTTEFGTGMPVFEEHESSYYQISGNRKWDDNQLHTISSMTNELNIHLPDGYEPKDYTITVPPGVYTTQELVDEIDDALSNMVPPNPGFVFELTSDGYCNLNFEKADGTPTKIDFVDGSLAYLIYDFQGGSMSASILGTTIFELNGTLRITQGQNDTLGFYTESAEGTNYIPIKIDAGYYTRAEMIDKINELLALNPDAAGVVAKEYGDHCIQITGGDKIGIVGLKGNMFKYEDPETTSPNNIYTSVFYDNVNYGVSSKSAASITGNYHDPQIPISINNSNNTLCFTLNGNYTTITLTNKDYKNVSELVSEINQKLKDQKLDQYITASGSNYLTLRCTLTGSQSKLEFDTTSSVSNEAFKTLFRGTSRLPDITEGSPASLTGAADLSGTFSLDIDAPLSFKVNGTDYTINIVKGNYTLDTLCQSLKNELKSNTALSAIQDRITFKADGNNLRIEALKSDVTSITAGSRNAAYDSLLKGLTTIVNSGNFTPAPGSVIQPPQGVAARPEIKSAAVTVTIPSTPIVIDQNSNRLALRFWNSSGGSHTETITLDAGTYNDLSALKTEIEKKLKASANADLRNTTVSYSGRELTFTSTPSNDQPTGSWNIEVPSSSVSQNYIWKSIFGTRQIESGPTSQPARPAQLTQNKTYSPRIYIPSSITLDSSNNVLKLDLGKGSATITLAPKPYTRGELQQALQTELDRSGLKPDVKVTINGSGYLTLSAVEGKFNASGSFYENVIIRQFLDSPKPEAQGSSGFKQAFIVGSKDLRAEPIEITSGSNDIFTFDFTYNSSSASSQSFVKTISVKITEGIYNADSLAEELDRAIKKAFDEEDLDDFEVSVGIGTHDIKVENFDDDKALQITVTNAAGKDPDEGQYIIDGVRGSSACFVFYKTNGKPKETYILGTKNIGKGVSFEPGKNVLTLSANSVPYKYTFDKSYYTAQEFLDTLNNMFENGDDNGNPAPLKASIENGVLKIAHKSVGGNTITDIGGSGRNAIFFEEEGRDSRDPLLIHVGSEAYQYTEIPRISVSSTALAINSITISKQKYAEKANVRIKEAIKLLSAKRSTYGAIQNRLEHTVNNNNNVIDRVQEGESRIRDTDLSSEMIQYTNLSILLRMGSSMIAESNQRIEKLMTILQ